MLDYLMGIACGAVLAVALVHGLDRALIDQANQSTAYADTMTAQYGPEVQP